MPAHSIYRRQHTIAVALDGALKRIAIERAHVQRRDVRVALNGFATANDHCGDQLMSRPARQELFDSLRLASGLAENAAIASGQLIEPIRWLVDA